MHAVPAEGGWRWRPAPGPPRRTPCRRRSVHVWPQSWFLDDEPESRLRNLVDDVVNARLAATPPSPDLFAGMSTNRKAVHLWADMSSPIRRERQNSPRPQPTRCGPPNRHSPTPGRWQFLAVRRRTTTRLPWQTADPALFPRDNHGLEPVGHHQLMLQRAWGTSLSDVARLTPGFSGGVDGPDVLEFSTGWRPDCRRRPVST